MAETNPPVSPATLDEPRASTQVSGKTLFRIRRVLLDSVGPRDARFDPLLLDFSTDDGLADRALLSLTNAGGKTTLLTLLTGLFEPHASNQIGNRQLGDYLLSGDTAHVVVEWEDSSGSVPVRYVTGTVFEWENQRQRPAGQGGDARSTKHMRRLWYLWRFTASEGGPSLDDVQGQIRTSDADGTLRRSTFSDYRKFLQDTCKATGGSITSIQHEWQAALLENTPIDPFLIRCQMQMSDEEGRAKALLEGFTSSDGVVRFFVEALFDEASTKSFFDEVHGYSALSARRPDMELETQLLKLLEEGLAEVNEAQSHFATQQAAKTVAEQQAGEFAGEVTLRIEQDEALLAEQRADSELAEEAAQEAHDEVEKARAIRLQLKLEQARQELNAAETAEAAARTAWKEAQQTADGWKATKDVAALRSAHAQLSAAQEACDKAEEGLAPLRAQVDAITLELALQLDAEVASALEKITDLEQLEAEADTESKEHNQIALTHIETAAASEAHVKHATEAIEKGETLLAEARNDGTLEQDETPDDALARYEAELAANQTVLNDGAEKLQEAEATVKHAEAEKDRLTAETASAKQASEDASATLLRFNNELKSISQHELLPAVNGDVAPADVNEVKNLASDADNFADDAAHHAQALAAQLRGFQRELTSIESTGMAPAPSDAITVVEELTQHGVNASTGLDWLEVNVEDVEERCAAIERNPDLAGGVVLADLSHLERAIALLDSESLQTSAPVTVCVLQSTSTVSRRTPEDAVTPGIAVAETHVVVPRRSSWDRGFAQQRLEELGVEVQHLERKRDEAQQRLKGAQELALSSRRFVEDWATTPREALERAVETNRDAHIKARGYLDAASTALQDARDAVGRCRQRMVDARNAIADAGRLVDTCKVLVKANDSVVQAEDSKTDALVAAADARRAAQEAFGSAAAAGTRSAEARKSIEGLRGTLDRWQGERSNLPVAEPAGRSTRTRADTPVSLSALRSARDAAKGTLAAREEGSEHGQLLAAAQQQLTDAQGRIEEHDAGAVEVAGDLLDNAPEADNAPARRRATQDAVSREESTRKRLNVMEGQVSAAKSRLTDAAPSDAAQRDYFDLSTTPEWDPTTSVDVAELLIRLDRHAEVVQGEHKRRTVELDELRAGCAELELELDKLQPVFGILKLEPKPVLDPFEGSGSAALSAAHDHSEAISDADLALSDATTKLEQAATGLRTKANGKQFRSMDFMLRERILDIPTDVLAQEAAELCREAKSFRETLEHDLGDFDTQRETIVEELKRLCDGLLRLLHRVSKESKLPSGLGALSGEASIVISFERSVDDVSDRLGELLDRWAQEINEDDAKGTFPSSQVDMLVEAIGQRVRDRPNVGQFKVEFLKPSIEGRLDRCAPEQIDTEYSGGQALTLAVLVYCTLAAVRSSSRLDRNGLPPGALLLDNPFGAASNRSLIELQHALAASSGVQLVCATGVNDADVENAFSIPGSVIFKLRNDRDQRRRHGHLLLSSRVVDGVDVPAAVTGDRDPHDEKGFVDGTSYWFRS